MTTVNAYAAMNVKGPLKPYHIHRREPGPYDVVVDIHYCGVCHSDIHQARDEWGKSIFPMVPGHEIVGKVSGLGAQVKKFKMGDQVGIGCFVDSCRVCGPCTSGIEQYCERGLIVTYNGIEKDGKTPTYGGYSTQIVIDENYLLKIPANLPLDKAAPLLCAGITTYSPLRHWNIKAGNKIAVVGLGGLGHMAVKIANAMGADVTVFSTSDKKKNDALQFGATHFVNTSNPDVVQKYANHFHFIINTVAANIDLNQYVKLLKLDATMVTVGLPGDATPINVANLISKRRSLAGSVIGGIKETQEMLDFCGKHGLTAEIELIPIHKINEAYDRVVKSDVRYRFVIDISTLK
jgi:alcohol dehydrogenase (NADP+)